MPKISTVSKMAATYKGYVRRVQECAYPPTRIWVEASSHCNLKCSFCGNRKLPRQDRGYMDFQLFSRIADECSGRCSQFNLFHRGESLLHPRIGEMVRYAGQRGIRTRINTNATLLTKEISRELIESGLDILSFSFDGYDPVMYESNRPGASFERVLANILGFLEMKKRLGSKKPFTSIEVMEIANLPQEQVIRERKDFLLTFRSLPLDKFAVREQHNWAGLINHNRLLPASRIPCPLLWHAMVVFWDGSVLPCPQDFFGQLKLGSLQNSRLMDIWNGYEMRRLRCEMSNPKNLKRSPCISCDRILRATVAGVPIDYLGRFLSENVFGNSWISRILPH
jgi:radical SAM protein with 4Fe4S-binding SPASM domain